MPRYVAKCGKAYEGREGDTKKVYDVLFETDKPIHFHGEKEPKKIDPPEGCDPKCLHRRRPQHYMFVTEEKGIEHVNGWRCKFVREDEVTPDA